MKWCFVPLHFFDYLFQETVSESPKYNLESQPGAIEIPIFMEFSMSAISQILQKEFSHSNYCRHVVWL